MPSYQGHALKENRNGLVVAAYNLRRMGKLIPISAQVSQGGVAVETVKTVPQKPKQIFHDPSAEPQKRPSITRPEKPKRKNWGFCAACKVLPFRATREGNCKECDNLWE